VRASSSQGVVPSVEVVGAEARAKSFSILLGGAESDEGRRTLRAA
jgi:hypothetical protein